jgi:hypothetical protein
MGSGWGCCEWGLRVWGVDRGKRRSGGLACVRGQQGRYGRAEEKRTYRMKERRVLSAVEVSIVVPSGDL